MWKLGLALGIISLAGCGGAPPTVEQFAAHQGKLWPAGVSGRTLFNESASGFVAWGVDDDGSLTFVMTGTNDELPGFQKKVRGETGIPAMRCQPAPTGDIGSPIPCPPGPTGQGGGSGTGGGQTMQ